MDGPFGADLESKYCAIHEFEYLFIMVKSAYSSFVLSCWYELSLFHVGAGIFLNKKDGD